MKEVRCRDVGVDCDFVVRGETEEELFRKAAEHGRNEHQMPSIPEEVKAKMKSVMTDV